MYKDVSVDEFKGKCITAAPRKSRENGDKNKDAKGKDAGKQKVPGEEKQAGRKEKPDDEKSEKTIANKESMN